jgi:transposase-like protein
MPKTHTQEFIEHALTRLHENGGNIKKTAGELNVARSVLTSWRQGDRRPRDVAAAVAAGVELSHKDEYDALASQWEKIAAKGTAKAEQLIEGTKSFKEAVVGAAIATDKSLLLRGKPNSSTQHVLRVELVGGGTLADLARRTMQARSSGSLEAQRGIIDVPALPSGDDSA